MKFLAKEKTPEHLKEITISEPQRFLWCQLQGRKANPIRDKGICLAVRLKIFLSTKSAIKSSPRGKGPFGLKYARRAAERQEAEKASCRGGPLAQNCLGSKLEDIGFKLCNRYHAQWNNVSLGQTPSPNKKSNGIGVRQAINIHFIRGTLNFGLA